MTSIVIDLLSCTDPARESESEGDKYGRKRLDIAGIAAATRRDRDRRRGRLWVLVVAGGLPAAAKPEPVDPPEAVQPARALDTRSGATPAPGTTLNLGIAGAYGVPSDAKAAIVNVTAVDTGGWGYLTVWPGGLPQPPTSSLNYSEAGLTIASSVVIPLGADGSINVYTSNSAGVLVDVLGYFPADSGFSEVPLSRVVDTRPGPTPEPFQRFDAKVTDVPGTPAAAEFALVTVTMVDSTGGGYVTVWPTGTPIPATSNVNVDGAGQTRAGLAVVPIGANGSISLHTSVGADLLVDVLGFLTANGGYTGLDTFERLLDTRPSGPVADGSITPLRVAGVAGVPATAKAVLLNVTADRNTAWNYLTVFPAGTAQPNASNVNSSSAGGSIANTVWVPVGTNGEVNIFAYAATDLIVDILGYAN